MKQNTNKLLNNCPIGHINNSNLVATNILLKEGFLQRCNECNHLISVCTTDRYHSSMQQFDTKEGTLPDPKSTKRAFKLHSKRLKFIQETLKKPSHKIRLLDVGCSSGSFLRSAKKLNFNVSGVEPATSAAKTAIENGFDVHIGTLDTVDLKEGSLDVITLFEVIEHLADPSQLLKECKQLLKKDGILLIGTGNTDSWTVSSMGKRWDYFDIDQHGGHVSFFNPKSIRLLADKIGFKAISIKTRCVKFYSKGEVNKILYKFTKVFSELLNIPAQFLNKGHDMLVVLRNH